MIRHYFGNQLYTDEVHIPYRVLKMTWYSLITQFTFFFHEILAAYVFLYENYEKNIEKNQKNLLILVTISKNSTQLT